MNEADYAKFQRTLRHIDWMLVVVAVNLLIIVVCLTVVAL